MKGLLTIACILVSATCAADGWSNLSGINKNGNLVQVEPAWNADQPPSRDYTVEENREIYYVTVFKGRVISEDWERTAKTYKNQRCKFKENHAGERIEFSCHKGDSPLSGTKYKIIANKNPNDCSYASKYICVSGCDAAITPRMMKEDYWECGESD